jgi:hypothetical protein
MLKANVRVVRVCDSGVALMVEELDGEGGVDGSLVRIGDWSLAWFRLKHVNSCALPEGDGRREWKTGR